MSWRALATLLSIVTLTAAACGVADPKQAPPLGTGGAPTTTGMGGGFIDAGNPTGPPPPDAGGLCGNEFHTFTADPPNVYFVLDASGSMAEIAGNKTKYEHVRGAAVDIVQTMGSLINVGAAVFPINASPGNGCATGGEVMPMTPGDPPGTLFGETTGAFATAINVSPNGGTPTSLTLSTITPIVTALPGRTVVVLATDGAPNCNAAAVCDADLCMVNLELCPAINDPCCDPGGNCCSPLIPDGPESCVDRQATVAAIATLFAASIETHVIGIPGSQTYEDTLDAMAVAGGAAKPTKPFYYELSDVAEIGAVLGAIAAGAVSCDLDLTDPPMDQGYTNVYFDAAIVPLDPKDGWTWTSPSTITLHGAACDKLKTGKVKSVQVVSGCPTEATK